MTTRRGLATEELGLGDVAGKLTELVTAQRFGI
jgi:hypothetical protein